MATQAPRVRQGSCACRFSGEGVGTAESRRSVRSAVNGRRASGLQSAERRRAWPMRAHRRAMHRVLTPADYRHTAVEERRRPHDRDRRPSAAARTSRTSPGARASPTSQRDGPFSEFRRRRPHARAAAGRRHAPRRRRRAARSARAVRAGDVRGRRRAATARCTTGRCSDFNLMVRRAVARGERRRRARPGAASRPARFRLCYAAAGACECLLPALSARCDAAATTLLVDDARRSRPMHVNPLSPHAVALVASIDLTAGSA